MTTYADTPTLLDVKQLTLREARERRGWTQERLESESGVEQSVISRLERGANANPTYDTVQKLEVALKVRRGALVFGQVMAEKSA